MVEKYKKQILDILFKWLDKDDCIVFLFGSHATDEAVRSSDIDIGILCVKKVSEGIFAKLQEQLNEDLETLREIDIVDFSNLNKRVKEEALKEIKVWHTGKNCQELLKSLKPH